MIEQMHERLNRWADWALSERRAKGLGYSACTLGRLTMPPSTFRMDPSINTEASETDDAVQQLDEKSRHVLNVYYLGRGTKEQKAADLGCHFTTMFDRVHAAQAKLVDVIQSMHAKRTWPVKSSFRQDR